MVSMVRCKCAVMFFFLPFSNMKSCVGVRGRGRSNLCGRDVRVSAEQQCTRDGNHGVLRACQHRRLKTKAWEGSEEKSEVTKKTFF